MVEPQVTLEGLRALLEFLWTALIPQAQERIDKAQNDEEGNTATNEMNNLISFAESVEERIRTWGQ